MRADEMYLAQRNRARVGATLAVALTLLALAILAGINRLAFTVPPVYEFLAITATNPVWIVLLGGAAFYTLWAIIWHREDLFNAMGASAGVLGAWSLINLLWGMNPVRPVSLAGPILALGMSAVAYFLARTWIRVGDHETRR